MSENPRVQAVRALTGVYGQAKTLDQVLHSDTKPLVRELVSGTLRHHFSLSHRVDELLTRKLRDKDLDVRCLLLIGAYQLLHTRIPDHAAVAETVACTKNLKKPWAKGLVNAVLRNLPSPNEEWSPDALNDHPHWFINALRNSLPEHWQSVLEANNTRAPMTLRVNRAKISPGAYRKLLEQANIEFIDGPLPESVQLNKPQPQTNLPGYSDGLVAVQDAAAQLAVCVANAQPGASVLDACAAPGGKGFHVLESTPAVTLTMQDISESRVGTLTEQAMRLGHQRAADSSAPEATTLIIRQADSTAQTPTPEASARFDLILLDAPCSGSGTVRRHPDIKVLRSAQDLESLNATQGNLLDALFEQLVDGGRLIYSTCSLFREENDAIIRAFLERHPTGASVGSIADRLPVHERTPFVTTEYGVQTLPVVEGGDGLYYAELIAATSAS